VVRILKELAAACGDRFTPCETLTAMAAEGRTFYPAE
jgi:hypothetical protein